MEPTEAWNRQWRAPLLSTLAGSLDPGTLQFIEDGWGEFFSGLANKARILDIGTGNGYLALLALRSSNQTGKGFEVHGADAAAIDPPGAVPGFKSRLEKIQFHPETPAENLRFADSTFDAVVGQHALEYCQVGAALREIARVLKPGGKARFLMHAAGGEILSANLPKIAQYRHILAEAQLFELAETSVAEALAGGGDKGKGLFRALDAAAERFRADVNTADLAALLGLLRGCFGCRADFSGMTAIRQWLKENRAEAEAALARIEAMARAAVREDALPGLVAAAEDAGFHRARADKLSTRSGGLLGWILNADKKLNEGTALP